MSVTNLRDRPGTGLDTLSSTFNDEIWRRNPSWPTITPPTSAQSRFVGLYAVFPGDSAGGGNFFAVNCAGNYTVDYGDGSATVNTASGVQNNYQYSFNASGLFDATVTFTDAGDLINRNNHGYIDGDEVRFYRIQSTTGITEGQVYYVVNATTNDFQISATPFGSPLALTTDGSASLLPYKIATVVITPQAGQQLTTINLNVRHNQTNLQDYATGWLDIALGSPDLSTLTIGSTSPTVWHDNLENINVVRVGSMNWSSNFRLLGNLRNFKFTQSDNAVNGTRLFQTCVNLKNVDIDPGISITNALSMFQDCARLVVVSNMNLSSCTSVNGMFTNCIQLRSVPAFNLSSCADLGLFFSGCSRLTVVPSFTLNTTTSWSAAQMFNNCASLASVPMLDTSRCTDMSSMFNSCANLTTVPLFDTGNVTNMSSMFGGCGYLRSVPLFNTAAVTNMTSMFSGCASLKTVPLFNTAAVTTMTSMFNGCTRLETVPLFNTAAVTNMSQMFGNCTNLSAIPTFNTAAVTNISSLFLACRRLTNIPALNGNAVTSSGNFGSIFSQSPSINRIQMTGFRFSFSVASCRLSGTALDEIYTNLPTVTAQTITVSSNYGTATDTPSIATAKGWTVTGS